MADKREYVATDEDAGERLDKVLAARIEGLSRRQARVLIDIGGVFVDGARIKVAGRKVRPGQRIVAHVGGALERATKAVGAAARARDEQALPSHEVVHEDADIIVVFKPAGLLTAPTPESDRNNLAALLGARVVHRIDLPTSGLLVFARNPAADRALSEQFRVHSVDREYMAVVRGAVPDEAITLDAPVGGKRAVTHLRVEERAGDRATRLRCRLETGRTHQIRIHCAGYGHPVLGDPRYGERTAYDPPRLALHAAVLGLVHPRTRVAMRFERDWPDDLAAWWRAVCHDQTT